jgi:hypothetical protein
MKVPLRIYYDIDNGQVIQMTGNFEDKWMTEYESIETQIPKYTALSERNRETFDVIELPFGAYASDFRECSGYRVNVETGELEFSYPDPNEPGVEQPYVKPLSEEVEEIKNSQMTANEKYIALDKEIVSLEELKAAKVNQLDEACNLAIISGFEHVVNDINYLFSSSVTAQANFQGTDTLFKDGLITEAEWTVVNIETGKIERIIIDQIQFNEIKLKVFQHINSNISRFRNILQPQVEQALTKEEVEVVVW